MNDKPPPLIRRRDIPKYFGGQHIPDQMLAKLEENDLLHPFRPDEKSRAWYYTSELSKILNGAQTT